ncbi:MAG: TRAP transporter small permease [Alphaproteobacteria bacterium]|nr:TRAP transporter small permease [Alphaproteobacteria bacterium]
MSPAKQKGAAGTVPAVARWIGDWPALVLGIAACGFLFFMMGFTFADVLGRYLFNRPLPSAYEIVSLAMPGVIFCALPMTNRQDGHVTIDLLDSVMPGGLRRVQSLFVNLLGFAATLFLAWRLAWKSYDHYRFFGVTEELFMPLWPFSAIMAALAAIAALAFLANAIDGGHPGTPGTEKST